MRRAFSGLCLSILVLGLGIGCTRQEFIGKQRCTERVGTKYYRYYFLGLLPAQHETKEYAILKDGREIERNLFNASSHSAFGLYCETIYEPVPNLDIDLNRRPPR